MIKGTCMLKVLVGRCFLSRSRGGEKKHSLCHRPKKQFIRVFLVNFYFNLSHPAILTRNDAGDQSQRPLVF